MVETGTLLQTRYSIEKQIGSGGMGAVYIAIDRKFGSRVAIKETFYGDPELSEAFEREARLLNSLHHPILPHVSDHFSENGGHFLVMEYIEGEDLSEVLKRNGAFRVPDVVRWTHELLDGLDYLHSQTPPIIHRDIKPNNLKLTSRGNIVLLDFGLAKENSNNTLGMTSIFGYSRRYSPLEQIEGIGTDARSDIFSLGATVYHLLTGKPPIDVLARASAIIAGRSDPLQLPSELNDEIPPKVAAVIYSALALNADKRFVSANALRTALEHAVGADSHIADPQKSEEILAREQAADSAIVGESSSTTQVDSFPALQAFKAEVEQDAAGIVHPNPSSDTMVEQDESQNDSRDDDVPAGVSLWSIPRPSHDNSERSKVARGDMGAPRKRDWQRDAAWLCMIVGLFVAISYAVYLSDSTDQPGEAGTEESRSNTNDKDVIASEPVSQGQEEAGEAVTDSEDAGSKTTPSISGSDSQMAEKPSPVKRLDRRLPDTADDSPTRPGVGASRPSQAARKPVVRRPFSEEVSGVSSIETIFTGLPPERGRRTSRQQMTPWEQEQLRRRQMRRIMRENRFRYPPF